MLETHPLRLSLISALLALLLVAALAPTAGAAVKTVWAVGDGADSGSSDDDIAGMIDQSNPDAFLYLGDVYEHGTASEFAQNYVPGYGRLKSITHPTPGNHEWDNRGQGYDPYWGPRFTSPHYYSFDVGTWHVISLNSEESHGAGSAQLDWLRADVRERSGNCTIAYWHQPRYSAGTNHGDETSLEPIWRALVGHVSVVLTGHDHNYQRLKPINGITVWVVGTGGHGRSGVDGNDGRLAASNTSDYGALRLHLGIGQASYAFISEKGSVLDSGGLTCSRTGATEPDSRSPRLTRLTVSRKRLRHGSRSRPRVAFRYTLSERATVTLTINRVSPRGDVRPLRKLTQLGRKGLNRKFFSGKLAGKPLTAGLYRTVLQATDLSGNRSKPKYVSFRVLKARVRASR